MALNIHVALRIEAAWMFPFVYKFILRQHYAKIIGILAFCCSVKETEVVF
jgi:hypothetical protein